MLRAVITSEVPVRSESPVVLGPAVEIDGTFNARDVGGVETAAGNPLRLGVLFRSASLDRVSEAGRADLARLGVRSIADLRASVEIERHGRFEVGDTGIAWRHLDSKFGPPSLSQDGMRGLLDADDPMATIYRQMMRDGAPMFRDGLRMLGGEAEAPMLVHCTSGKDRTGLLAAMVQLICGVPFESVLADYERSALDVANVAADMAERYPEMSVAGREKLERMSGTDRAWVLGAFDEIGGVEALPAWFAEIGVGESHLATIRSRLLD